MKRWTMLLLGGLAAAGCATRQSEETGPGIIITQPPAPPPAPPTLPAPPVTEAGRMAELPGDDWKALESMLEDLPATAAGGNAAEPVTPMDFLPFTDVGQIPYLDQLIQRGDPLLGSYTRIRIVNDRQSAELERTDLPGSVSGHSVKADTREARDYGEESRSWLARRFGSRKVTRAFLVEFNLDEPDITASTALFSTSFESDVSKGEAWSTDESLSAFATPYFRVGPNTVLNATFKLKLAEEGDADVGANVVAALNTAASLIAPISPVVTMFTAPEVTQAANFLDSSVSNLFGRSIEETTSSALALKSWSDAPIFMIELNLPSSNDIKDGSKKHQAGKWAVYLDRPIISIFLGAHSVYDMDLTAIDPGRILAFVIGQDLTVYDYIFARLDLADRIDAVNQAAGFGDTAAAAEEARRICNRVGRGLSEVGLNSVDIAIAWWALSQSEQFDAASVPVLLDPELCLPAQNWTRLRE